MYKNYVKKPILDIFNTPIKEIGLLIKNIFLEEILFKWVKIIQLNNSEVQISSQKTHIQGCNFSLAIRIQ